MELFVTYCILRQSKIDVLVYTNPQIGTVVIHAFRNRRRLSHNRTYGNSVLSGVPGCAIN